MNIEGKSDRFQATFDGSGGDDAPFPKTASVLPFRTRQALQMEQQTRKIAALFAALIEAKAGQFPDRRLINARLEELGDHLCGMVPLSEAGEAIERGMLKVALARANGNHAEAAAMLYLGKSSLEFILRTRHVGLAED